MLSFVFSPQSFQTGGVRPLEPGLVGPSSCDQWGPSASAAGAKAEAEERVTTSLGKALEKVQSQREVIDVTITL